MQSPITVDPSDAEEFIEIVNTVAAKDQPLLIRWYKRLVAKQQAQQQALNAQQQKQASKAKEKK